MTRLSNGEVLTYGIQDVYGVRGFYGVEFNYGQGNTSATGGNYLLLENGDFFLLEATSDYILLET